MPPRSPRFGHDRERAVRRILEKSGWFVIRAPGSLGPADLVALRAGDQPRMYEIKATAAGPFAGFGPADRRALKDAAERAGATPQLVWWPANKPLQWIDEADWPEDKATRSSSSAHTTEEPSP